MKQRYLGRTGLKLEECQKELSSLRIPAAIREKCTWDAKQFLEQDTLYFFVFLSNLVSREKEKKLLFVFVKLTTDKLSLNVDNITSTAKYFRW